MNTYRSPLSGLFPPVVLNLLIANVVFFIAKLVIINIYNYDITEILGLHYYKSDSFRSYQLITYMFQHEGFQHIFFNMFGLWMFGQTLENFWGPKKFLLFYVVCGIGAGLTQEADYYYHLHQITNAISAYNPATDPSFLNYNNLVGVYFPEYRVPTPQSHLEASATLYNLYLSYSGMLNTIGASGAIFGILLAFGMLFPNTIMYFLFFPVPVKAKWVVLVYGLWELYSGVSGRAGDTTAHFAHLGGMLFGFLLIMYWKNKNPVT
jgi:membrane associated rhomboid family serine protease